MIVKVEIEGETAMICTKPGDKPAVRMEVPASRVRKRFKSASTHAGKLTGYFSATEAVAKNIETNEEYPLDVVELGDPVPMPEVGW